MEEGIFDTQVEPAEPSSHSGTASNMKNLSFFNCQMPSSSGWEVRPVKMTRDDASLKALPF